MPSGTTSIKTVIGAVGDIAFQPNMFGEFGGHVGAARAGLANEQLHRGRASRSSIDTSVLSGLSQACS